jgi:hypothetical protein
MSQEQINHSPDLEKLQNAGYEIEVKEGCAIIYHVPYLKACGSIAFGTLVSPVNFQGNCAVYDNQHVIYFDGEQPCRTDGTIITGIVHSTDTTVRAGIPCKLSFSNKPKEGYKDYYYKFTRYIEIISAPAVHKDNTVTAATFKKVISDEQSIFIYADTNSSRCGITEISKKLKGHKIGIIGLGGTGSYVLDLIAKTPVDEIHLFDGDMFCQHNAFRAPGAPNVNVFSERINKAEYYYKIYSQMHKGITMHSQYIDAENIDMMDNLNFVFLCIDSGEAKRIIVEYLIEKNIHFIDTGIDVNVCESKLLGTIRNTAFILPDKYEKLKNSLSFEEVHNDLYCSSIQTAELNSLCATIAVLKWKKEVGFYQDLSFSSQAVYDTNDGEFKYDS